MANENVCKLKKIYALVLEGSDGEKEAAEAALSKLLKKYHLTLDDLNDSLEEDYIFEYHSVDERKLLVQVVYQVLDRSGACLYLYNNRTKRYLKTKICVSCTKAQFIEIEYLYDFYKRLWEQEKQSMFEAFVQKHEIFGTPPEDHVGKKMTEEEYRKLKLRMRALSDETPRKQLTEGNV